LTNLHLKIWQIGPSETAMHRLTHLGMLGAAIGSAVLIASSIGHAQIDGALQYPPPSVGKDAQPPPPAGMVPQIVSPRRIELGVSGSSQPPVHPPRHSAPALGASPAAPSTANGN
jgi:hypothetical protein